MGQRGEEDGQSNIQLLFKLLYPYENFKLH